MRKKKFVKRKKKNFTSDSITVNPPFNDLGFRREKKNKKKLEGLKKKKK